MCAHARFDFITFFDLHLSKQNQNLINRELMMMSSLSMVEANLPAGFRFHPRDSELICDYLINKIAHCEQPPFLIQVDLNKCEPWDIPESACVGGKEWYFYSLRDRKYATGLRTNRATISGYWKATGKDRPVKRRGTLVGMRKTLVFYQGRAPKGKKTDWVMHEFRLEGPFCPPKLVNAKEDWVLCRVFYKNSDQGGNKQQPQGISINNNDHDTLSSTSLPPLMEPCITFDQTLNQPNINHHEDHFEQVPCFSIFSPNHMNYNPQLDQISYDNNNMFGAGGMADMGSYINNPTNDKKVLKAVLNHLNNNTTNCLKDSPSFGDQGSSESFLSDVGMPTVWYHV